jgi:hypothetical protein
VGEELLATCAKLRKVATDIFISMNKYSSLEPCIGNKPQGGALGILRPDRSETAPRLVFRAHPGEARPKVELVRVQAG